ncbi:MAG: DUF86 domain-containing protein [bacterium]|nr:DUF86 domain-containing protein [bacterium]
MTEITKEIVVNKLSSLEETLEKLKKYQALSKNEYFADERNELSVERLFQTGLETVVDIARYLIIENKLQKPGEKNSEFEILANSGILSEELAVKLTKAKSFRNVLVHDYLDVDPEIVYENLQNNLGDLEQFVQIISKVVATNTDHGTEQGCSVP